MSSYFSGNIGFVDAHIHLKNAQGIEDVAAAGIVAVRDAGTREKTGVEVTMMRNKKKVPRIVTSGWALFKRDGYGSLFGVAVATNDEIRAEISKLKYAGADIIKVMASGMVNLRDRGAITPGGFTREELQVIVDEAGNHGLSVIAHANGEEAIADAVEAGVRSIEHGFFMSKKNLDVMGEKGTFWVPTVGALRRAAASSPVTREASEYVDNVIQDHLDNIRYAQITGVPLAVGTDSVLPNPFYKEAYETELAYFEQAGIAQADVIHIASGNGLRLLAL